MRTLLVFFILFLAKSSLMAQTNDSLILNNSINTELKVFYFTSRSEFAVPDVFATVNKKWIPFVNKQSTIDPSDKMVTWFKIVINNQDSVAKKLFLTIPSLTRSDLWFKNNSEWIPIYKGGILQGNSNTKIRPEYEEIIPLVVNSGENTYLLKTKINLVRFNPLQFQIFSQKDIDKTTLLNDSGGEYDKLFQFAFFTVLLFQLLFIITQFFFIRRLEYVYYIAYILILGFYFLSKGEFLMRAELFYHRFPHFFIYLDHSLSWFSAFIYYRFARSFINLPEKDPRLNKQVIVVEYIILFFSLYSLIFSLWSESYVMREKIYVVFSVLMTFTTLAIIYRFLIRREALYNFAIVGSLLITLGSISSIMAYNSGGLHIAGMSLHPISIFQLSVVLELLCFTTGLAFKSRLDAREKIISQQELIFRMTENQNLQLKLNTIRDDIARDLHDEVGSTLSSISLYSEAMKHSLKDGEYKRVNDMIAQVGQNSRETLENMKEIIWAINAKNDKINNLRDRLHAHAASVFSAQGIIFNFNSETELNSLTLSIDFRKNILLLFKECINNISKHSEANEVEIRLEIIGKRLRLSIKDNGKGFDTSGKLDGNGLQSMRDRASEMNGGLIIKSSLGSGTLIEFFSAEVFDNLSIKKV